jgi:hypothetical protein
MNRILLTKHHVSPARLDHVSEVGEGDRFQLNLADEGDGRNLN